MFQIMDTGEATKIAVVAAGKAGCKIASKLPIEIQEIADIFYLHTQTDFLIKNNYGNIISIETSETKNFGTNGEAYLGHNCARENRKKIISKLSNYEFVFIVSGLGGGTGSGATPYLAKLLRNNGTLCISIVSFPFDFEGDRKNRMALSAYSKIKKNSDSLILVDNNKILDDISGFRNGFFDLSDKYMSSVIYGLAGLLAKPGLINVDLVEVKTALAGMGISTVGIGTSRGENRATIATNESIKNSQLFRKFQIHDVKGIIVSITAGLDMGIYEFEEVGSVLREYASDDATVVVGTVINPEMIDELEVIITYSGFSDSMDLSSISNDKMHTEIFRSITFDQEHIQAGISILSYFGEVLKQKYSDVDAKVRIERNDNSVTLIIESQMGVIEKIERALDTYGDIVTGEKPASQLLDNQIDIERLKMKLEMSSMEIRQSQNIINLYKNEKESTGNRIDSLEREVESLHSLLGNSIKNNSKLTLLSRKLIQSNDALVKNHIQEIEKILKRDFKEKEDEKSVLESINILNKEDNSSLKKVQELFINTTYGVTGNTAYDFLISLINVLPK